MPFQCGRWWRRNGNAWTSRRDKNLSAFSEGVNAAIEREPLPVEFRVLAYRPRAWTPQDSLAVGMATVLDLIDDGTRLSPGMRHTAAAG